MPAPASCHLPETLGATEVFASLTDLEDLPARLGKPLDAVVDAVGSEAAINAALPLIKGAGSICVYGVIGEDTVRLHKHRGPYNFNLLVHQWPTRALECAAQEPLCTWVEQGRLDHRPFLSAEFPVTAIDQAIELPRLPRGQQDLSQVFVAAAASARRSLPLSPGTSKRSTRPFLAR